MNKNNGQDLPDISHIFDIDERKLSSRAADRPTERRTGERRGSILIPEDPKQTHEERRVVKEREEQKRKRSRLQARLARVRKLRRRLVAALLLILLVSIGVFVVNTVNRPLAEIVRVQKQTVNGYYEASAAVFVDTDPDGTTHTSLIFVENQWDVYKLDEHPGVVVPMENDRLVTGVITRIVKEAAGSATVSRLMQLLPDTVYSGAVNYTVHISLDSNAGFEDGAVHPVRIITQTLEDALTVPADALFTDANGTYLWSYNRILGNIRKLYVNTQLISDGTAAITAEGLKAGKSVACRFSEDPAAFKNGKRVKKQKPPKEEETTIPTETETEGA